MGEVLDGRTRRLLTSMLHHGRFTETSHDPETTARLCAMGYATPWRTSLGREAIVLTDRGVSVAERLEEGRA